MKALVIGFGNPLRGDDGLGWHAALRLKEEFASNRNAPGNGQVTVISCHQLTPELSDPISKSDLVIFIDARDGTPPGVIQVERVEPISLAPGSCAAGAPGALWHSVSPAALLTCAQIIFGRVPQSVLVSVTAESFEGEHLSARVEDALEPALVLVRRLATGEVTITDAVSPVAISA
jgi:hydrogenase maturation protease